MAYMPSEQEMGLQPISEVSTTQKHPLGKIIRARDDATTAIATGAGGWGEFIYLAVATSTAITAGLFYSYTPNDFKPVIVPTSLGTQGVSGFPLALAVNAVSSDATNIQYTWFQIGGRATALKTAVMVIGGGVPLYTSGATAGRVKVLGSAFRAILGARAANATSVTSTTSTIAIYMSGRPAITAGI